MSTPPRPRTFYGDPDDPVDELITSLAKPGDRDLGGPRDGDELCDGHVMHYVWKDGKWQ